MKCLVLPVVYALVFVVSCEEEIDREYRAAPAEPTKNTEKAEPRSGGPDGQPNVDTKSGFYESVPLLRPICVLAPIVQNQGSFGYPGSGRYPQGPGYGQGGRYPGGHGGYGNGGYGHQGNGYGYDPYGTRTGSENKPPQESAQNPKNNRQG